MKVQVEKLPPHKFEQTYPPTLVRTSRSADANIGVTLPQLPCRHPNYMLEYGQAFFNLRPGN